MTRFLLPLLCVLALGGCVDDDGIIVVNESPETITFRGKTLEPDGDRVKYIQGECTDSSPLSFITQTGAEYVRLESEYCPGQTWTITGPGEIVLSDSE